MTDKEQELLRYDNGRTGSWIGDDGSHLTVFHLQWLPDKRKNGTDILHNPTICLPSVGLELVAPLPEVDISIKGVRFRFNAWQFKSSTTPVFVFTAVRRERDFDSVTYSREKKEQRLSKLRKVVDGNRGNPVETLQVVVVGPSDRESAIRSLVREMEKFVSNG